ncbi:aldehyde dehydrogenase family protein [Streptomyces flavofungini]|uniref:Aldehyde dehydrogenase n=1 Tax=Streptomyces flavofungini TaxID=68200 RepID=A0ABS0XJZ7_9ACTN|nr:aldehyde dehydrogenase [Streptomyces flavofungini]MBJ3813261.1 aldehyde dehydrogenase [Streptomyces flavofungini]GHC90876.1 putative aldehyde dehydrogenase [Streptomyces flavofungini]
MSKLGNSAGQFASDRNLRSYHSYINGRSASSESTEWVYVLDSRSVLDDVFASLALKRNLEQGRVRVERYPESICGRVAKADRALVRQAVSAAAAAAPRWRAFPLEVRLERFGALLYERLVRQAEEIVEILVREGNPLPLARWQVSGMLECFSAESIQFYRSQMLQELHRDGRRIQIRRRPDGVVCVNPPQNAPLSSALLAVTSLMAGNTLVIRAPRGAPLGVMYVLQDVVAPVLDEIDAPPGTLNALCGDPGPMLSTWLEEPSVNDIMYFGNSENGLRFEQRCISAGKKPILELAGNDIVAVWKDSDVDLAAEALSESFYGSGQLCMIPNQVLVHPEVADALIEKLLGEIGNIRPGYPDEADVLLTPVLRNEKFFRCLDDALSKGAELICGGHAMQDDGSRDPHGIFLEPTVISVNGLSKAREVDAVRQETFFPLLPLVIAESAPDPELLDAFIAYVNSNECGLRNSVWARDTAVVDRFVNETVNGGLLKVNDSHISFLAGLPTHGGTGLTGGVFGEANYPMLRTSHVQGVSISAGSRPREAVFDAWRKVFGTD